MAESKHRRILSAVLFLVAIAVILLCWLWQSQDPTEPLSLTAARIDSTAESSRDDSQSHARAEAEILTDKNSEAAPLDCSGDFEALIGQYQPALAARLKQLDAQRRFIDASGPFTNAFGELSKLSYPGYESYDMATLLRLGDNGDQVANVIYAAHQLGDSQQLVDPNTNRFDADRFEQYFSRLQRALEAGQVGALYLTHYVLKERAMWSSERTQHHAPLSNRGAVIEAQAWQLATATAGTLAERVIAQHFGDALDKGAYQLVNDEERQRVQQRSEELLAGPLRNLRHAISDDERQTEMALKDLFAVIENPALAKLNCRDGRTLQHAINETFIDD